MLKLHTYFRSSAAFRVRIALNLKQLDYTAVPVHLLRDGGEQHQPAYMQLNPSALLPTLDAVLSDQDDPILRQRRDLISQLPVRITASRYLEALRPTGTVMISGMRAIQGNQQAPPHIHEAGLFQGRYGFERSIILLEDGCEEFSNIFGIGQIRFKSGHLTAVSEELRRVLEREGVL